MVTNVSTLGQNIDNANRLNAVKSQLDDLTRQLASGKKTDKFSGLGTQAITSQRLRADIKEIEFYDNNITRSLTRVNLQLDTITSIKEQAKQVDNALSGTLQQSSDSFNNLRDLAGKVLDFIQPLLNEELNGKFLFAGSDVENTPIGELSDFRATIAGDVTDWQNGTITTEQLIASYDSYTDAEVGYSATLSTSLPSVVRADSGREIDVTTRANNQAFKDILTAIAMVEQLPDPPGAPDPDLPAPTGPDSPDEFFSVVNDLATKISEAMNDLDDLSFQIGSSQAQLKTIEEQHRFDKNIFETVVSQIEDADLAETITRIQQVQVQLEASFQVTSIVQQLSLSNFIR